MTTVELMDHLAAYIRELVMDYDVKYKSDFRNLNVYSGWPPVRTSATEKESFIYVLVTKWDDTPDREPYSKATVEVGFSIYDNGMEDGWRSLYNLMEHVRQGLLRKRTITGRNTLDGTIHGVISDNQPFPQWQGSITADYSIGQPEGDGIDFDNDF